MKKTVSLFLCLIILISACPVTGLAADTKAIEMTPQLTDAVYQYLDDIYIERFPGFGLEFSFGSEKDRDILQKLADKLTKNCRSDREKTQAVVGWADRNIKYRSYTGGTYYFPIDVFYYRTGNCLGLGLFISQVLRLAGVNAVFCAGTRGNMKDFINLDGRETDHGWVMVYHDNCWNLYDPLFDVYGTNDREFISRWYFTDFIEGVSPYYEGMNCEYVLYGDSIFYIDGRFIHYRSGMPASEYYGTAAEGGTSLNGCVPYFSKNRYAAPGGGGDGFQYLSSPERRDDMVNDECYSDGWIGYGDSIWSYAHKNGIMAGCTVREVGGEKLYLPFNSAPIRLPGDASSYSFTCGRPTFLIGEKYTLPEPIWVESEKAEGRVITYECLTPETADITKDGRLTVKAEGEVTIAIASRDYYEDPGCMISGFIELYFIEKEKEYDYSDNIAGTEDLPDMNIIALTDSTVGVKSGVSAETLLSDVLGACVKDTEGNEVSGDKKIGSGMTVSLPDGSEYSVVVKGDLDSNGEITASDARLTLRASVGLEKNDANWFISAGNITQTDIKGEVLTASDARLILRGSVKLENTDSWFYSGK
ncbi:MAG: transglutaminase family protein [Ruminococcaceae bacterium]|nr:transglutaminase family protein [Oscillospiraceae bacterium]